PLRRPRLRRVGPLWRSDHRDDLERHRPRRLQRLDEVHHHRSHPPVGRDAGHRAASPPGCRRAVAPVLRLGLLSTARVHEGTPTGPRRSGAVEVVAVASRDVVRALAYAQEHDIERAHGSYEELLDDRDIDAIYIGLPNSMHVEWSIRALEAGKHVLCEKPMSRPPEDGERAFDVADQHDRVLMEAFMYRHPLQSHALHELVLSGRAGQPRPLPSTVRFP